MLKEKLISAKALWQQRLGYGAADLSCNLTWQMVTLYLMYYYTDVVGISVLQVSMLFLVVRLLDGLSGIFIGFMIDRTTSKWGKSRPYFLWGATPFCLFSVVTFYNPYFSKHENLVYAYLTYGGLSIAYNLINIPLASILPDLTDDQHERTTLATTRIIFSFIGAAAVSGFSQPLVNRLGKNSPSTGFFRTMFIYALCSGVLLIFTFSSLKEKKITRQKPVSLKKAYWLLKTNRPWRAFALNILFMWGGFFLQQGSLIYFYTYNISRPDLVRIFAIISAFIPIIGTFSTPVLARIWSKRVIFILGSSIYLLGILITIISITNLTGLYTGSIISALGFGLRHAIYFSMQADPVDYGIAHTGKNVSGIISSVNGLLGKVSMAGAGALAGSLMACAHYVPNHVQRESALETIKLIYLWLPGVLTIISIAIIYVYNHDYKIVKPPATI